MVGYGGGWNHQIVKKVKMLILRYTYERQKVRKHYETLGEIKGPAFWSKSIG